MFKRLVVSIIIYGIADILSFEGVNYNANLFVRYIGQSLFLFASAYTPFALLSYICSYVFPDEKNHLKSKMAVVIFCSFFLILFIVNYFKGIIFYFDERTAMVRGKAFKFLPMLANLCSISCIVCFITNSKKFSKFQLVILYIFTFATMLSPTIQAIFLFYRAVAFMYSIFLMLLLLVIETPDEQALSETIEELEMWKDKLKAMVDEKTKEAGRKAIELESLAIQMMYAVAEIIDAKDVYTSGHSSRVARYSKMIAQRLGFDEDDCKQIFMMGMLHDIGKVGVSRKIINKEGPLSDGEFKAMKEHPKIASEILEKITLFPKMKMGARWHHERIDGRGYPDGLKGDEIPLEAKIIAVADAYDAMTSYRSYRSLRNQDYVKQELEKDMGTHFDAEIVRVMLELIEEDSDFRLHEYRTVGGGNAS